VKAALVVERLRVLDRQIPGAAFRVLGWIHRNGCGFEKVETCPPATLIKPPVFRKRVVEDMYTAFIASVDTALHAQA
jgi:hypothetical protein